MRGLRAVLPAVCGSAAGYVLALLAASLLQATVPDAELVWNRLSAFRVGAWILEAANGVPTVVRSAAGVEAPQAPGSIGRLSELLGGTSDLAFTFSLFLVPITILAVVGLTTARLVRRSAPASGRQLAVRCAASAVAHGGVLSVVAWLSSFEFFAEGRLAPDLGLGAATGHVAIGIGHAPSFAFGVGAVWGAAFAAAGGLSSMPLRATISPDDRIVLLGWMRGLATATAVLATVLAVGGIVAVIAGRAPSASLVGLGALLLSGNAVAAGIVGSNGISMAVALDAGPFTGWERVDLLNVGTRGEAAPLFAWLILALPLAAGIVAGRFARRRGGHRRFAIAWRYGVLWGLTLAVLSLLLRVRVLSSFSVGGLDLGGGSASFDPLVALLGGLLVGTVAAYVGARSVRTQVGGAGAAWTCAACGIGNADGDRFCVSCGATRAG